MGDIDVGGLLFWGLLFWAVNRPQVQVVREPFRLRDLFARSPRTDP